MHQSDTISLPWCLSGCSRDSMCMRHSRTDVFSRARRPSTPTGHLKELDYVYHEVHQAHIHITNRVEIHSPLLFLDVVHTVSRLAALPHCGFPLISWKIELKRFYSADHARATLPCGPCMMPDVVRSQIFGRYMFENTIL